MHLTNQEKHLQKPTCESFSLFCCVIMEKRGKVHNYDYPYLIKFERNTGVQKTIVKISAYFPGAP